MKILGPLFRSYCEPLVLSCNQALVSTHNDGETGTSPSRVLAQEVFHRGDLCSQHRFDAKHFSDEQSRANHLGDSDRDRVGLQLGLRAQRAEGPHPSDQFHRVVFSLQGDDNQLVNGGMGRVHRDHSLAFLSTVEKTGGFWPHIRYHSW